MNGTKVFFLGMEKGNGTMLTQKHNITEVDYNFVSWTWCVISIPSSTQWTYLVTWKINCYNYNLKKFSSLPPHLKNGPFVATNSSCIWYANFRAIWMIKCYWKLLLIDWWSKHYYLSAKTHFDSAVSIWH